MSLVSEASRRIEMVNKKYRNSFIGLSVFGISLIMFAMDYSKSVIYFLYTYDTNPTIFLQWIVGL